MSGYQNYFRFMSVLLVLLLVIFDTSLGLLYSAMILATFIWFAFDKRHTYQLASGRPWGKVIIETGVTFAVFSLISTYLLAGNGLNSIFQLLATATPILKGSSFLTFIGWGIVIPLVETILFFVILQEGFAEWYARKSGSSINVTKFSMKMVIVMVVVAGLFALFHLTAKNLQDIPLLVTFLFGLASAALVTYQKEARGAIMLHVLTNSAAVLSMYGVFS